MKGTKLEVLMAIPYVEKEMRTILRGSGTNTKRVEALLHEFLMEVCANMSEDWWSRINQPAQRIREAEDFVAQPELVSLVDDFATRLHDAGCTSDKRELVALAEMAFVSVGELCPGGVCESDCSHIRQFLLYLPRG